MKLFLLKYIIIFVNIGNSHEQMLAQVRSR